ncbi:cadherin-like domain-containing protein [Roseobacter sp.]|uniref:cadherin-like domain-containing protein n=1 Tax=Roseobacter sp. TaxID=1907202 RepID=UPI0038594A03
MAMKTPGVYIVEKNAFPNSVVQVATAVPAFVGYTEKAMNGNVSLSNTPWRITSMSEFHSYFGFAPDPKFEIVPWAEFDDVSPLSAEGAAKPAALPRAKFTTQGPQGSEAYELVQSNKAYALYGAMRLFFQNGGGACYIVSVGTYADDEIDANKIMAGISLLKKEPEPTMLVIPETTRMVRQNAVKVQQAMLKHCGSDMKNRFAILDISGGHLAQADPLGNPVATFRNDIGINDLDFGTAYYPWVDTSIFQSRDFNFENIDPKSRKMLIGLMKRSVKRDPEISPEIDRVGAPVLAGDFTLSVTRGGTIAVTEKDVVSTDDDTGDEDLVYQLDGGTDDMAGALQVDGADATTFTQADLKAGKVSYVHAAKSGNKGKFDLIVTDKNGIATDAKTIDVEVVGGLLDPSAVEAGTAVEINVPADHPEADKATVKLIDSDDADGKAKSQKGVGDWTVGNAGKVTFKPDPEFAGPEAVVSYTIVGGDGVETAPALLRVLMDGPVTGPVFDNPSAATIDKTLRATVPLYSDVMNEITAYMNGMPPAAAMAGIYTAVDANRGVWKAPANVSVNSVVAPKVNINHEEQENLNVSTTGKSINAIRPFVGEGTLVWGARTLDGNSLDWRYINVRRTMIMIEESIRLASKAYVFEPNNAQTWVTMRSMIENFLTSVWKAGGLAGAVPTDAFSVHVGLGETMTPVDILEGILRITVLVAVTRPAEFIEVTFQQQMQKS